MCIVLRPSPCLPSIRIGTTSAANDKLSFLAPRRSDGRTLEWQSQWDCGVALPYDGSGDGGTGGKTRENVSRLQFQGSGGADGVFSEDRRARCPFHLAGGQNGWWRAGRFRDREVAPAKAGGRPTVDQCARSGDRCPTPANGGGDCGALLLTALSCCDIFRPMKRVVRRSEWTETARWGGCGPHFPFFAEQSQFPGVLGDVE